MLLDLAELFLAQSCTILCDTLRKLSVESLSKLSVEPLRKLSVEPLRKLSVKPFADYLRPLYATLKCER